MEKKPFAPAPNPGDPGPGPAPAPAPTGEVVALLLEVLRNINREVKTTLELSPEAQAAVANFRSISAELSTTRPFASPVPPAPPPPPPPPPPPAPPPGPAPQQPGV